MNAKRTLGSLKLHIIATSLLSIPILNGILSILFPNIEIISNMLILELPMEVPIHIIKNAKGIDNIINPLFLLVFI